MRKALNRERVNVGSRSTRAHTPNSQGIQRVPCCNSCGGLRAQGRGPEELAWIDIAQALNELAKSQNVVVISQTEFKARPELVEDIKRDGRQIVLITDKEKQRADQQAEQARPPFKR